MVCVLCECAVNSNQRRKLQVESTRNVLCFLLEYCYDQPQLLQQPRLFICRPCVRLVESTQKMREDLKRKELKIKEYMERLLQQYERCIDFHSIEGEEFSERLRESIFPAQKRTISAAELPSTPTRMPKRCRYETPTRETLNRMHSIGSSPAVAVSTIHIPYKQ